MNQTTPYFHHVGSSSLLLSSSSSVPVMDCILSLSRLHPSRHHYCSPPNQNSTKTTGGEERRGRQQLPEPAISLSCLVLPATASSTVLPLSSVKSIRVGIELCSWKRKRNNKTSICCLVSSGSGRRPALARRPRRGSIASYSSSTCDLEREKEVRQWHTQLFLHASACDCLFFPCLLSFSKKTLISLR